VDAWIPAAKGGSRHIYKVFSEAYLATVNLDTLFAPGWVVVRRKRWAGAYPKFAPPEKFAKIRLTPAGGERGRGSGGTRTSSIFYLNAIESATSAMEISAIAGKNIAMLIGDDLTGRHGARFRQKFTLEDAIGSHACLLQTSEQACDQCHSSRVCTFLTG
jgi:hypothetical protein